MTEIPVLELIKALGLPGLIFCIWYYDKIQINKADVARVEELKQMQRIHEEQMQQQREEHKEQMQQQRAEHNSLMTIETEKLRMMESHQKDMINAFKSNRDAVLTQFEKNMNEMRVMYTNNVSLVKNYQDISRDIKDAYIMATQEVVALREELRNDHKKCPANVAGFGCLIPIEKEEERNGKRIRQ